MIVTNREGVMFAYLQVELQGARTTALALLSAGISSFGLVLALAVTGFAVFGILPGFLLAFAVWVLPKYLDYLDAVKSTLKAYAQGSLEVDLIAAYRRGVLPQEPRLRSR